MARRRLIPNFLQEQAPEEEGDESSYFDPKAKKRRLKEHRASKAGQAKKKTHQKKPKAQEKKTAKAVGGRRQPGSGSLSHAKGDVKREGDFALLVENKRVDYKRGTKKGLSIGVKAEWLGKITREAFDENASPALAIQFDDEVMRQETRRHGVTVETDWIALPLPVLKRLLERLGEDVEL
jgi:hypothetical protein